MHQAELELQNQELRDTQTALARARDRYFNLFDLAPVAYFVFDEEHRIAELNLSGAELLRRERARLKGVPFFPCVALEQRSSFHEHLNLAFQTRQRQSLELRLLREGDGVRQVQMETILLPGEVGASPLCLSACLDVTERRVAEEGMRESQLRFHQLATATDVVFLVFSVEPEQMLYVNPAFEQVWGIPCDRLMRQPQLWLEAVVSEDHDRVSEALNAVVGQTHGPRDIEYRIRRPDNSVRWVLDSFRPIFDNRGKVVRVCGIARDITERKQAEQDRLEFERKLLETQKLESLGVLAGGIAHDFNNLLTGILGNAGLARMDLEPNSPVVHSLEQIETAANRASDLCRQMLAYSGKGRFVVEPLDLNDVIYDTTRLIRFSISKKAILKQQLSPRLPRVMADATQMRQILMNLVLNASEALGEQSGFITISTDSIQATREQLKELHLSPDLSDGEYVILEVIDTGCGMPPDILARIFDPFFSTKFTGRGLGLAAVLGIVRGHKGGLKVTTEPGKGTSFRVMLPAHVIKSDLLSPGTGAKWGRRLNGTILLVDDEDVVRQTASRILKTFDLRVVEATDGREGLSLFEKHGAEISCILLDLTMPHLSGEETFEAIRRLNTQVPIIIMSGYSEHEAIHRFPGKGLSGFLQKPFTPEHVHRKLQAVLGASR